MPEHPCSKGLKKECFLKYPTFFKRAMAYRTLFTIIPKTVLSFLKKGLDQPLVAPEAITPPGTQFPSGWVIFPDVNFPPGWTIDQPPPPGVFPPPIFSPLLPESGASGPLFIVPSEARSPGPPSVKIEPPSVPPSVFFWSGPGDQPVNFGDSNERICMSFPFLPQWDANLTHIAVKIGASAGMLDNVFLRIHPPLSGYEPDESILIAESDQIPGTDLPPYSPSMTSINFIFPSEPLLLEGWDKLIVFHRTGPPDWMNYFQALGADDPSGQIYYKNDLNFWGGPVLKLLELEGWGNAV